MATLIRAAGGVVWRPVGDGLEICLVHRERYDDWSLPKGKLESGEHPLAAAVREVAEETGVHAVPQVRLAGARYTVREGFPKTVDYWSMRYVSEEPALVAESDEVNEVRWLPVDDALALLTYSHDTRVVRDFAVLPAINAVCGLVRHAHAGKRGTWSGPDSARPLDKEGRARAGELARLLALLRPAQLVSATPLRCRQTLEPLAALVDLPIAADSALDEPVPGQNEDERVLSTAGRLAELAAAGVDFVACSQGKVMPGALAQLVDHGAADDYRTPKGGGWLLAFAADGTVAADRL
ncbi:NUDIX domain-containing protein [Asanoa sp. WMMD1127]|uniref:NUDIX domain-containing protein n=1 Tax=Asanoa sp. WMMD1127 TaxID=3016107 RepID=UPI0024170AB1|nr:NUDIX domain-containing protein [Asanoa sp. WMMD1127]MDG4823517.1 NUDIX domain-containing protein [Asanoa sp. WMMD1127]